MSKQYRPNQLSSSVRKALKKSRPQKIPISTNLESTWRLQERESFCRDIPSLEEQKPVGFNNIGMLSSFPYNGEDREPSRQGEFEQLGMSKRSWYGRITDIINDDEQAKKFILEEQKRFRAEQQRLHNNKVGTKQDELSAIQALVILELKQKRYKELKQRKLLFKFQHQHAPALSMNRCSLMPIYQQQVTIYTSPTGYSFGGLATCDNPNCVRCSRKRAYKRARRIQSSIQGATLAEKQAYFVTLTMKRSDDIAAQIKRMKKAWKAVQNKLDKVIKKKYKGTYATARAMDITFKLTGYGSHAPYNLHLHCVIIIDVPEYGPEDEDLSSMIKKIWCNSTGQSDEKGQDIARVKSPEKLARYCAKMAGLAMELSSPHTKKGKKKNSLSLPQLMEKGIEGNQYAIKIYKKFLVAMKGMKTLSFSKNWDNYSLEEPEKEEEEEGKPIVTIPRFWWHIVKYHMDDIGIKLWKSIYIENEEDLTEFHGLMSIETIKEFEDWFGEDCSPSEEFHAWLSV